MSRQTSTFDTDNGTLLVVHNGRAGMVGESVEWQELYFIRYTSRMPEVQKVDFAFAEPILREHLDSLKSAAKEFGPMPGLEGIFKSAMDYALHQEAMSIENINNLIHLLSPEGQQEQHDDMTADAISRVI